MKPEPALEFLDRMAKEVERQLKVVTSQFQNLTEAELNRNPSPDSWNISQCFWHLNSYCEYYLPRMEKSILGAKENTDHNFKSGWMGSYFIKLMQPLSGSKKMKAIKDHMPTERPNGSAEIAKWIDHQEQLLVIISKARAVSLNSIKIPTSLLQLIRLNLGDALQFVIVHQHRHLLQAQQCLGH